MTLIMIFFQCTFDCCVVLLWCWHRYLYLNCVWACWLSLFFYLFSCVRMVGLSLRCFYLLSCVHTVQYVCHCVAFIFFFVYVQQAHCLSFSILCTYGRLVIVLLLSSFLCTYRTVGLSSRCFYLLSCVHTVGVSSFFFYLLPFIYSWRRLCAPIIAACRILGVVVGVLQTILLPRTIGLLSFFFVLFFLRTVGLSVRNTTIITRYVRNARSRSASYTRCYCCCVVC